MLALGNMKKMSSSPGGQGNSVIGAEASGGDEVSSGGESEDRTSSSPTTTAAFPGTFAQRSSFLIEDILFPRPKVKTCICTLGVHLFQAGTFKNLLGQGSFNVKSSETALFVQFMAVTFHVSTQKRPRRP